MANAMKFEDVVARVRTMQSGQSERNSMFEEIEDMYLLNPKDLPDEDWIKKTVSPDPRNSIQGMQRLLTAAEPTWSVPPATNTPTVKKISSQIEKFCAAIWLAAGKVAGRPIHVDVSLSALLYGEIHLTVSSTKDLAQAVKNPADKKRKEAIAARTPLMFDVINPSMGFPEWDAFGLRAYYSRRKLTVGEIRGLWGEDALASKKDSDEVDYHDYWDLTNHCCWAEGESDPFLFEPHELPAIPVVAVITEGSRLFYRAGQQTRQPALYSLWKSHLWDRQNLALTIMNSLVFSIGSNPMFVWKRANPDKKAPNRDYDDTPGGLVVLDNGEDYQPLAKQILDPSLMTVLEMAQQLGEESTIYRQTLGEPLGANAPFSMVSLLSQAGRLPLVPYLRGASFAISQAMSIGLMILKEEGGVKKIAGNKGGTVELDVKQIPDQFDLTATLDVSLPQDDRQNAAVAAQLTGGPKPITSLRYVRENLMKIGQSDDMDTEIFDESRLYAIAQARNQAEVQKLMMKLQMEMQKQQMAMQQQSSGPGMAAPGMAGPAGASAPQGGTPADLSTQLQGNLQSTGAEPGLPGMIAGVPMEPGAPGMSTEQSFEGGV